MPRDFDDQFNKPLPENPDEISRGIDELINMTRPSASRPKEEFLAPTHYTPEQRDQEEDGGTENDEGGQPLTAKEALGNLILSRQELALRKTLEYLSGADLPTISVKEVRPSTQNWEELEMIQDPREFGMGTINPETKDIDFAKAKICILEQKDMEFMNGKKLSEVAKYLIKTYGDKYYLPGVDYMQWFMENPDKSREPTADDSDYYFHFFGSTLCRMNGVWCVPSIYSSKQKWHAQATFIKSHWDSNCRVILIEK